MSLKEMGLRERIKNAQTHNEVRFLMSLIPGVGYPKKYIVRCEKAAEERRAAIFRHLNNPYPNLKETPTNVSGS